MNNNIRIEDFNPTIQMMLKYFSDARPSLTDLGKEFEISKQAVHKRIIKGVAYLNAYDARQKSPTESEFEELKRENQRLQDLSVHLKRLLILKSTQIHLFKWFQEKVREFFPKFKFSRFKPHQKKILIEMSEKFRNAGGTLQAFCKAISRSPETLIRWKEAYKKHGLGGLKDKSTRPRTFGNKIPLWVKQQLLLIFSRFPNWTPYQYHKHIRFNPTLEWYVSLPTIRKLQEVHTIKSQVEKDRIKKNGVLAQGQQFGQLTLRAS